MSLFSKWIGLVSGLAPGPFLLISAWSAQQRAGEGGARGSSHKGHLTVVEGWLCPGPVYALFPYSGTCILPRWESLCPSLTDTQQMANTDSIQTVVFQC